GHDDGHRNPRNELRARGCGQDLLPRRRRHPRGGTACADVRVAAGGADTRFPAARDRSGASLVRVFRRFRRARKSPLAIASLLAMPLFFASLVAVSLAREEPTTVVR